MYAVLFGSRLLFLLYAATLIVLLWLKAADEINMPWATLLTLLGATTGLGFLAKGLDRITDYLFPRPIR